jgi:hypothetical protein
MSTHEFEYAGRLIEIDIVWNRYGTNYEIESVRYCDEAAGMSDFVEVTFPALRDVLIIAATPALDAIWEDEEPYEHEPCDSRYACYD